MRRMLWVAGLLLSLGGCVSPVQERLRAYNQDAIAMFQRGDYKGARQNFQAALDLQPDNVALLYDVGQCSERLGETDQAEQAYRACLQRAPGHTRCRHALCRLLVHDSRTPEAVALVEEWLAREPQSSAPYAADGWLWHQAGDLPRAQARLQQALQIDPRDPQALTDLGELYEEMQRPDRAAALYERALQQDPHQPEVLLRLQHLQAQGAGPPRPDD